LLLRKACNFDELFDQEDTGAFGRNYITGLLWALEGIAWEEAYLSRTTVVLDLAQKRDCSQYSLFVTPFFQSSGIFFLQLGLCVPKVVEC
jgi:hypothetical protein